MDTITAKDLAVLCNTTGKRLRAFIRACDERGESVTSPVGSGARYAFTRDEAHAIIAAFAQRTRNAASGPRRSHADLSTWLDASADVLANIDAAQAIIDSLDEDEGDALDEGDA